MSSVPIEFYPDDILQSVLFCGCKVKVDGGIVVFRYL